MLSSKLPQWAPPRPLGRAHAGFLYGRLTSSNVGTCVLSNQDSNVAPQTLQDAWPVCGTKNFVSVRLYSAPQSHWTIVAILGICPFGEPVQAGLFAAIKSDPLPGLTCSTSLERQGAASVWKCILVS